MVVRGTPQEEAVRQAGKLVRRGANILAMLTARSISDRTRMPRGTEFMPIRELTFAKGLVFSFVRKVGFGLSYASGPAFLIARVQADPNLPPSPLNSTWSAPLFLRMRGGSLGVSVGGATALMVTVLDTLDAVARMAEGMTVSTFDVRFALLMHASVNLPTGAIGARSKQWFSYAMVVGMTVDVSMRLDRYRVDAALNASVYGPRTSPRMVLDGSVEPPLFCRPLWVRLEEALERHIDDVRRRKGDVLDIFADAGDAQKTLLAAERIVMPASPRPEGFSPKRKAIGPDTAFLPHEAAAEAAAEAQASGEGGADGEGGAQGAAGSPSGGASAGAALASPPSLTSDLGFASSPKRHRGPEGAAAAVSAALSSTAQGIAGLAAGVAGRMSSPRAGSDAAGSKSPGTETRPPPTDDAQSLRVSTLERGLAGPKAAQGDLEAGAAARSRSSSLPGAAEIELQRGGGAAAASPASPTGHPTAPPPASPTGHPTAPPPASPTGHPTAPSRLPPGLPTVLAPRGAPSSAGTSPLGASPTDLSPLTVQSRVRSGFQLASMRPPQIATSPASRLQTVEEDPWSVGATDPRTIAQNNNNNNNNNNNLHEA